MYLWGLWLLNTDFICMGESYRGKCWKALTGKRRYKQVYHCLTVLKLNNVCLIFLISIKTTGLLGFLMQCSFISLSLSFSTWQKYLVSDCKRKMVSFGHLEFIQFKYTKERMPYSQVSNMQPHELKLPQT